MSTHDDIYLTFALGITVVGPGESVAALVYRFPRMSTDVVDEESRLALLGSVGIEGKPEWVAQSDDKMHGGELE